MNDAARKEDELSKQDIADERDVMFSCYVCEQWLIIAVSKNKNVIFHYQQQSTEKQ
jgi:hypothetical protein